MFINGCLRKTLLIFWPEVITSTELLRVTKQGKKQSEIGLIIRKRKVKWLGHILRRSYNYITRMALDWNSPSSRLRGHPKHTWERSILTEAELENLTQNKVPIEALCSMEERDIRLIQFSSNRKNLKLQYVYI